MKRYKASISWRLLEQQLQDHTSTTMAYSFIVVALLCFIVSGVLTDPAPPAQAVVLPFTTNFKLRGSHPLNTGLNIAALSRTRAATLHANFNQTARKSDGVISFPIDNAFVICGLSHFVQRFWLIDRTDSASVGIGSPATQCTMYWDYAYVN